MALGTYGIVRPADVSPDDVDVILHYTASRDVTDNYLLKKLNAKNIFRKFIRKRKKKIIKLIKNVLVLVKMYGTKMHIKLLEN